MKKIALLILGIVFFLALSFNATSETYGCCVTTGGCRLGTTQTACSGGGGTFYPGDPFCTSTPECDVGCCCWDYWPGSYQLIQYRVYCEATTRNASNFGHVFGTGGELFNYRTIENIYFCNRECGNVKSCSYPSCEQASIIYRGEDCVCGYNLSTYYSPYCCEASNYVSSDQQSCLAACAPKPTFSDVPLGHWAYSQIEAIFRAGITSGCYYNPETGEKRYCPGANVTRAQMAVFLIKVTNNTPYNNPTPTFVDVPKNQWAYGFIERVYQLGITSGCRVTGTKKYYCPDDLIKRDQMAVFLTKAANILPFNNPTPTFADVPKGYWAYPFIEAAYRAGITSGCKVVNGKRYYCPDALVKRDQMAVFLHTTFLS